MNVDNLRLAKDMKYEAVYWALGFEELEKNTFYKLLPLTIDNSLLKSTNPSSELIFIVKLLYCL